jgi:hypothetical protein
MLRKIFLIGFLLFSIIVFPFYCFSADWSYPFGSIPGGFGGPALGYDGIIYAPGENQLIAFYPDGNLKWVLDGIGTAHEPSIDRLGNIYILSTTGVTAIDSNKNILWSNQSPEYLGLNGAGRIIAGLNNNIYVVNDGPFLDVLDSQTGNRKQRFYVPERGIGIPGISSEGIVYNIYNSYIGPFLAILNTEDGSIDWVRAGESNRILTGYGTSTPVIGGNGDIYFSGSSGLAAYKPNLSMYWMKPIEAKFSVSPVVSSPVIGRDGTIYFVYIDPNEKVFIKGFSPDGNDVWTTEIPRINWSGFGEIVVGNDDRLYIASMNSVYSVDPKTNSISTYLDIGWFSPPVMGTDGTLYVTQTIGVQGVGNVATLYAISTSATGPSNSSWPMWGANAQHTNTVNYNGPSPQPTLTVILDPQDGGTVTGPGISCGNGNTDCQQTYALGTLVSLTAQENDGYTFQYWDDGNDRYSDSSLTFTMDSDKTIAVKFKGRLIKTSWDQYMVYFDGNKDGIDEKYLPGCTAVAVIHNALINCAQSCEELIRQ